MYATTAAPEEVYAESAGTDGLIAAFTLHHLEKKVAAAPKTVSAIEGGGS
jgi:hypothetical protein